MWGASVNQQAQTGMMNCRTNTSESYGVEQPLTNDDRVILNYLKICRSKTTGQIAYDYYLQKARDWQKRVAEMEAAKQEQVQERVADKPPDISFTSVHWASEQPLTNDDRVILNYLKICRSKTTGQIVYDYYLQKARDKEKRVAEMQAVKREQAQEQAANKSPDVSFTSVHCASEQLPMSDDRVVLNYLKVCQSKTTGQIAYDYYLQKARDWEKWAAKTQAAKQEQVQERVANGACRAQVPPLTKSLTARNSIVDKLSDISLIYDGYDDGFVV